MRLSNSQLTTLRTRPQQSTLFLSIFEPQVIFQATINDASIARGARTITYSGASGSHLNIESGMTLLIGTTAGARDVGKIRIRSATSGQIIVGENSNIPWQNGQKLTVLKYVELWPIYPRIVANPADEADSIFYKDYDIPYTNQNSILGTFPCAGPNWALFKGERAYYSSTGTLNLLGSSLNFNWTFEGGSPSSSSSAHPGFVTYNTPGDYVTKLQISGSNGSVDTTYRYVSVYDRPGEGNNPPITKWELTSLGGSRDEGGYKASFKVYEDVPISENAVVILFSDDWYGNTRVSLGGNYPNAEKIFFVGYVIDGSIHYNSQYSYVEFSVASISELMKESLGFSVSVESVATPDRWYELLDMDCRRAIYHYLKWHTTALQIADFQFVGDDRKIQFFDADRTSMYDAIDNLMRNTLIGKSVADRQGKMWMEVEAKAYSNPTGSFPAAMEITKRDWARQPVIEEKFSDQLSYLEFGGIAYSGVVTGTFAAILASAPGNAPSFRGRTEVQEGLALLGQAQLSELVGNVWANENADYPKISMDMAINARNLDIAPQETTQIHILPSDTVRGEDVNGLYIPGGMDWLYDAPRQILLPSIDFTRLVNGISGEDIYVEIPSDVGDGFNVPGIQIPPFPTLTFPSVGISNTGSSCCDSLAAVTNSQCCTVVKGSMTIDSNPTRTIIQNVVNYEFNSNPNMYDPDVTDGSNVFGIGASGTYSITLSFNYIDTSTQIIPPIKVSIGVTYNTAISTGIGYDIPIGSDGFVQVAGTASLPSSPTATGFLVRINTQTNEFILPNVVFTNIRLTVCKLPS